MSSRGRESLTTNLTILAVRRRRDGCWRAVTIVLLMAGWVVPARAQEAPTDAVKEINPLVAKQEMILERFERFQDRVFGLRQQLLESEPENAARLGRALSRAGELALSEKLEDIIRELGDPALHDRALESQSKWLEDADRLLSILLEQDDENDERKKEIERLEEYQKRVAELLAKEQSLREQSADAAAAQRMREQLDQAIRRVDALLERQKQLGSGAPSPAQADPQKSLSRDTEQLAEDLKKLAEPPPEASSEKPEIAAAKEQTAKASQSAQSGAQAMNQAGEQLSKNDTPSTQGFQKQAQEALKETREQLEEAKKALDAQPRLTDPLAKEQKDVSGQTKNLSDQMKADAAENSQKGSESGKSGSSSPGSQNLNQAQQEMDKAAESLNQSSPEKATPSQDRAIDQLQQAQEELEKALAQLRKEEREETLRDLEARFRDLLAKQRPINESTVALDKLGTETFKRAEQLQLADLSARQRVLSEQAGTCLHILDEDATTVAFPRIVGQLVDDMKNVSDRLAAFQVGRLTQKIEEEIVETLEQLLGAVQKMQQENEQQAGKPSSAGDKDKPLLPPSAELKLLRSSQLRINDRTVIIEDSIKEGASAGDELKRDLRVLAVRQTECTDIARQMQERKSHP